MTEFELFLQYRVVFFVVFIILEKTRILLIEHLEILREFLCLFLREQIISLICAFHFLVLILDARLLLFDLWGFLNEILWVLNVHDRLGPFNPIEVVLGFLYESSFSSGLIENQRHVMEPFELFEIFHVHYNLVYKSLFRK